MVFIFLSISSYAWPEYTKVLADQDGIIKIKSSKNKIPTILSAGDMIYDDGTTWQTTAGGQIKKPILRLCNLLPTWEPCPTGPVYGNGTVEAGESCDDGNTMDGDGCSSCQIDNAVIAAHTAVQMTSSTGVSHH